MGWMMHHGSPSNQLHNVAGKIEVERTHTEQSSNSSAAVSTANTQDSKAYPMQPKRVADKDLPFIASSEVQKHDGKDGNKLFIVVDNIVLDCTSYVTKHPGGRQIIHGFGGQDCGWQWWTFHNRTIWNDVAINLRVGRTEGLENKFVKPKAYIGLRSFGYQDDD